MLHLEVSILNVLLHQHLVSLYPVSLLLLQVYLLKYFTLRLLVAYLRQLILLNKLLNSPGHLELLLSEVTYLGLEKGVLTLSLTTLYQKKLLYL